MMELMVSPMNWISPISAIPVHNVCEQGEGNLALID